MSIRLRRAAVLALAAAAGLAAPRAAGAQQEVEARVVRVAADGVWIDRGRDAGIDVGDRVRVIPLGASEVEGRVTQVEARSAQVRLDRPEAAVVVGTPAEVLVPPGRTRDNESELLRDPDDPVPDAPPEWEAERPDWDPSRPLLAASPQRPHERRRAWSGRVYATARTVREQEFLDATSTFARAGFDLRGDNPWGFGGRARVAVDFDHRAWNADGSPSESDSFVRVERLSYAHGGDRFQPLRWEAGRFAQHVFPELGLLDGVEVGAPLTEEVRVGGSAGWMPEPDAELGTGTDFQVAAFVAREPRAVEAWRWGAALQQTWHDGEEDRRLAVFRLARPSRTGVDLRASAWVDVYEDADFGKDSGVELTRADLRASGRVGEASGWSAGAQQWRYPSQLRFQAGRFGAEDLFEGETTRIDGRVWTRWSGDLRVSVRADAWESEDRDGVSGEVRADWSDLLGDSSRTGVTLYRRSGSFVEATGLRLDQSWTSDLGLWRLGWDSAQYAPRDGGDDDLLQHDARLEWSLLARGPWSVTLDLGHRFGDDQSATSAGFFLQRSF